MRHIYLDLNQLYYIRRIADEAQGWDYGDYRWAYQMFAGNRDHIRDIRALCYIVALEDEWQLQISASEASFAELCLSTTKRAQATREAWHVFRSGIDESRLALEANLPRGRSDDHTSLGFIEDADDRLILWHFATEGADVFLTSDHGILKHKERLAEMGLRVMRASEWLDAFLGGVRGDEDAVDWLERVLFGVGR